MQNSILNGFNAGKKSSIAISAAANKQPTIPTPELPFGPDSLEPHISADTLKSLLRIHNQCVDRTNTLVAGTPWEGKSLEEIIQRRAGFTSTSALFDNASQALNFSIFWRSLRPTGGGRPIGRIARHIDTDFRGFDDFTARFRKAALSIFGSGWVWLVVDVNKLRVVTTKDAKNPLGRGFNPILGLSMWEHAYYLDHGSHRANYVEAFLSSLLNWEFANENLTRLGIRHMMDRPASNRRPAFEPESARV